MSDLAAFLSARLDEDEQAVRSVLTDGTDWEVIVICQMGVTAHLPAREHIERWSPARMLAEVAAKRRMLDDLYPEVKGADEAIEGEWNSSPDNADALLEMLALPYAGHPDYRQEWKP